jgi:hypothetical protein
VVSFTVICHLSPLGPTPSRVYVAVCSGLCIFGLARPEADGGVGPKTAAVFPPASCMPWRPSAARPLCC